MTKKTTDVYEIKNERLNEIVELLEGGNLPLEQSIQLFEEASNIVKELKEMLKTQKGKITKIKQDIDSFIEEDF